MRLVDIFALGPAMIYLGATGLIPGWMRVPSVAGGVFTIYWNAENYLRLEAAERGE